MKTVNVIVSVFFFTVNASVGVNATELKCEHLFGYVYNNPEKKMIPISTDTISFVDFEAKKYKDSVEARYLEMKNTSQLGDESVGIVLNGTGSGFFTIHYNKKTKALFKTTNRTFYNNLTGIDYIVIEFSIQVCN